MFFLILLGIINVANAINAVPYVDPFIGTEGPFPGQAFGGGDAFPGASLPFGVVKLGIDTNAANISRSTLNGGYTPDGNVTGISFLHESGTGGAPKYGIISQMPLTTVNGSVNVLDNQTYSQPRNGNDTATVGYYKTNLANGVTAEMSASRHAGIIQYSFPAQSKNVLADISHYLPGDGVGEQYYVDGEMTVANDSIYSGYGSYIGGWNNEPLPYTVYFCGEFNPPPDNVQLFTGTDTDPTAPNDTNLQPQYVSGRSVSAGPLHNRTGAIFSWNSNSSSTVRSRVGVSFLSTDKACQYKNSEIPSWNLNTTVQAAQTEWNRDVFNKIVVPTNSSANQTRLTMLYSALYKMHLMPSDRTGENPLWESSEPSFDDFYTLWDIFRCTVSLYHLIQPTYYEGMIRSLIDIWRHEGYMPDGRSGNYNGLVQGGSNSDNVLADAYVKGLRGHINWTDGFAAMQKNAEVPPANNFDVTDPSASTKEGRGGLQDWLKYGYITQDHYSRCISRTVEYSLNDFALSQVAAGVAPDQQQNNWQNIWNPNQKSLNFTGFLAPKYSNGTFNETTYNPRRCDQCEWQAITYEAVPFEYSFTTPHDVQTMIQFMGGAETFESRLDTMFVPKMSIQNLGANGAAITTLYNPGNEPDFTTPFFYNYLPGKQYKSVLRSRETINTYFFTGANGLPGNSDAGALDSYEIWQMLGIYPVVTQPVYLILSPFFDDITMSVGTNQTLRIRASGLSDSSYYVQSVKLNGQAWNQSWFSHNDLMTNGGTLDFELGSQPTAWDTGAPPPSPGHVTKNATSQ